MMVLQHSVNNNTTDLRHRPAKPLRNIVVERTQEPQNTAVTHDEPLPVACPTARIVLACLQNALRMGTRTQMALSPPGRARRELQQHRRKFLGNTPISHSDLLVQMVGPEALRQYDAANEEVLQRSRRSVEGSEEDASSADDEEGLMWSSSLNEEAIRARLVNEPLYNVPPAQELVPGESSSPAFSASKLPFWRRKIGFFDSVAAPEQKTARSYVQSSIRQSKQQAAQNLARHLRKIQRQERRKRRTSLNGVSEDTDDETGSEEDDSLPRLNEIMTPALAAALIVESLQANRVESVEGMSKCYDGIVNAGVAILDTQIDNDRQRRSEILAALTPLLITSLEQTSGDVILALASLRSLCGTVRYQRRFVQRIAPLLVRPPSGALWCLRHQQDMEAILACTELILDAAPQIWSAGWYERGRLILADSKRAETLDSAAQQLRSLSHEPSKIGGLLTAGGSKWNAKRKKEGAGKEPLAEWEVLAVVHQIKTSLSSVMRTDWTKVTAQADVPRPFRRKRHNLMQSSSVDASPKASIHSSPRSPARPPGFGKASGSPASPPNIPTSTTPETMENVFGPSFASSEPQIDRAASPPPELQVPVMPRRDQNTKQPSPGDSGSLSPKQPPKSPKSPSRDFFRSSENVPQPPPLSPKRNKTPTSLKETVSAVASTLAPTPLSPSASSVGTSGSSEIVSCRPQSATFLSGPSGTNYRTLTSTAAERKRTVAACRALRAQIQRFEDAFIQHYGHAPKGNAERAPLATTYAQYREWKRAIRADAACRIQALLRGAYTRSALLRSNNIKMTRVILKRRAAAGSAGGIDRIAIPADIGNQPIDRNYSLSSPVAGTPENFGTSPPGPHWASSVVRRRTGSGEMALPTGGARGSMASPTDEELNDLPLEELQSRKRELKRQLKQYDMTFARRHGRMPVKAEKEPIRHLYESYNALKSKISRVEDGARAEAHPDRRASAESPSSMSSMAYAASQRSDSPGSDSTGNDESPVRGFPRSHRRIPRDMSSPPAQPASPTTTGGNDPQDLQSLRAEKSRLHQLLRSYEREFFEEHRRQVSSFSDIRPVAGQYRRYKEIKRSIAALQDGGR